MIETGDPALVRAWVAERRRRGERVAFVPTMGFLHEGHLALVDAARAAAPHVVMSIFVNPLQFGPTEDLARYPRDLPRDRALAEGRGVGLLFVPTVGTMYPAGAETRVTPGDAATRWEGAVRPGHFAGVLTVVLKLFNLVQPDVACFGQKDIQQVTLVRQMVRDLDVPVELVVVPTAREADGLARSSRNVYLQGDDRARALVLARALAAGHAAWLGGEGRASAIEAAMRGVLEGEGVVPDYIALCESTAMAPVEQVDAGTIVAVAARIGPARLIDNIILGLGAPRVQPA